MNNEKVDQILDKYQGKARFLIRVLMEIQHELHWLSRDVLMKVSDSLEVPCREVIQIATFYKTFPFGAPGTP